MALRYIFFLLVLCLPLPSFANETKEARSALTRAVMGIPIVKYTKKDIEYKLHQTDYKFLFYLGPVVTQTFRFRHDHMSYNYDYKHIYPVQTRLLTFIVIKCAT